MPALTPSVQLTLSSTLVWELVDVPTQIPSIPANVVGYCVWTDSFIFPTSGFGIRRPSEAHAYYNNNNNVRSHRIIPCDANGKIEVFRNSTAISVRVVGYLTDDNCTMFASLQNLAVSSAGVGSWETVDVSGTMPAGAVLGIFGQQGHRNRTEGNLMRPTGTTGPSGLTQSSYSWGADESEFVLPIYAGEVDVYAESDEYFYAMGYFTGGEKRTGTLPSKNIVGAAGATLVDWPTVDPTIPADAEAVSFVSVEPVTATPDTITIKDYHTGDTGWAGGSYGEPGLRNATPRLAWLDGSQQSYIFSSTTAGVTVQHIVLGYVQPVADEEEAVKSILMDRRGVHRGVGRGVR